MPCMHLIIDELRKRVTLCIIAVLECREHYLSITVVLQSHFRRVELNHRNGERETTTGERRAVRKDKLVRPRATGRRTR